MNVPEKRAIRTHSDHVFFVYTPLTMSNLIHNKKAFQEDAYRPRCNKDDQ